MGRELQKLILMKILWKETYLQRRHMQRKKTTIHHVFYDLILERLWLDWQGVLSVFGNEELCYEASILYQFLGSLDDSLQLFEGCVHGTMWNPTRPWCSA